MAQYAHLSTIDPEFASLLPLPPRSPLDLPGIKAARQGTIAWVRARDEAMRPRLPAESAYSVTDYKVPVDGGEIAVRCVVPSGAKQGQTFPVLMWFHGGGWIFGSLEMNDARLRILAVEHQISVINVDYRLLPEHPFPIPWDDCYFATKWAVDNASTLAASFDKGFLVGGYSAGANLAASVTLRARDDPFFARAPLTGQLLLVLPALHPDAPVPEEWKSELLSMEQNKDAPVLTKEELRKMIELTGAPPEDTKMSILLHPSQTNLPPAYFQIAGCDPLRDEGFFYAKLLEQARVKTKVDVYPGVPHGFEAMFPDLKASDKAFNDLDGGVKWLLRLIPISPKSVTSSL